MKKIDKNARWWIGEEKEWIYQDSAGDWWVIKDDKEKEQKKMNPCIAPAAIVSCGNEVKSLVLKSLIISLLGVSIALNIFLYFKVENFKNVISTQKIVHPINLGNSD